MLNIKLVSMMTVFSEEKYFSALGNSTKKNENKRNLQTKKCVSVVDL